MKKGKKKYYCCYINNARCRIGIRHYSRLFICFRRQNHYRKNQNQVVIDGKDEKLFFSDYYNGIENMSKSVTLSLKTDGKEHTYKIFAIDSWGAESTDCVVIKTQ